MNTELLARLQSTYRDLDLFPLLEPEDIERFRVEYGQGKRTLICDEEHRFMRPILSLAIPG